MKTATILIPVLDEAANLPALFKALKALKGAPEILFIDNGSTDGSLELLENFCRKGSARLLHEKEKGFAEPLNRGLAEAKGAILLFLDADALPAANWVEKMREALEGADIAVGETSSRLAGRATSHGQVGLALFAQHSLHAARAEGYALPWGPTCNLGVTRGTFDRVDLFSPEAAGAFDIDWCWRAVLQGAKLVYAPEAKVKHTRRNDRGSLLRQFDRYGRSEAWLQKTYAFLLGASEGEPDPLVASVDAYQRLLLRGKKLKGKELQAALGETAAAFASGVRAGYSGFYRPCRLKRARPSAPVHWQNARKGITVFVSGKGVTEFAGKGLKAWEAWKSGASDEALAEILRKTFGVPAKEALGEAREFRKALTV